MAVKPIVEIGHKVLKLKNREITDFKSPHLKTLIRNLRDTMKNNDLIGIAAPPNSAKLPDLPHAT